MHPVCLESLYECHLLQHCQWFQRQFDFHLTTVPDFEQNSQFLRYVPVQAYL